MRGRLDAFYEKTIIELRKEKKTVYEICHELKVGNERVRRILKANGLLKPRPSAQKLTKEELDRTVYLVHTLGLSFREAAQELGVTSSGVSLRLDRAGRSLTSEQRWERNIQGTRFFNSTISEEVREARRRAGHRTKSNLIPGGPRYKNGKPKRHKKRKPPTMADYRAKQKKELVPTKPFLDYLQSSGKRPRPNTGAARKLFDIQQLEMADIAVIDRILTDIGQPQMLVILYPLGEEEDAA